MERDRRAALAYDARRATVMASGVSPLGTAGVSMSVLPARSSYDPATGRAALP